MRKATKAKAKAKPVNDRDPLDVNHRLYLQLGRLLDDMERLDAEETMTFPQRVAAMIAIGRVQKMFADLRKADFNAGGSEIRKYAAAFTAPDGAGGGAASAGNVVRFDGGGDSSERDDDDGGDDWDPGFPRA
jgi:hypothetical protein